MTSRDFVYWLQGFFEISEVIPKERPLSLGPLEIDLIKKHLNMVFHHEIDPSMGGKDHQGKLQSLHLGLALKDTQSLIQEHNLIARC